MLWLPQWLSSKESTCIAGDTGLIRVSGRSPGGGHGNPLQYSCLENPMDEEPGRLLTERLDFHFSLSCIGEGNGNPLQCSCLENPRDGGAWWAAVYGVAQSRTRLKRLSIHTCKGTLYSTGDIVNTL